MHKLIHSILIVFDICILFAAATEMTSKTTTTEHPLLKTTTTPKIWGLYSYEVIFSNATALRGNQFIQIFRAFKRLHVLKMSKINDGTDFSNYIDKEKWSKYKGQLTKFSPYEEENLEAIGQVNGSFFGAIYAKNDPIYFEEVPKKVRNAPGWQNSTAIVYNNSQQKPFAVISPGDDVQD